MPLLSSPENAGDRVARTSTDPKFYRFHHSYPHAFRKLFLTAWIILPMLAQGQTIPPPTADAGRDIYRSLPINKVKLSGKGEAYKGGTVTFLWSKLKGPAEYYIGKPESKSTVVSSLVQGEYYFLLTVTDERKLNGFDTVKVTISPKNNNLAPVAHAGKNETIFLPKNNYTLNGSAEDPEGSINSTLWTQIYGPDTAIINEPKSLSTKIHQLIEGDYQFKLVVTDYFGSTGSDVVTITVKQPPPKNKPPIANAGIDQTITTKTTTLIGSGKDPDGTILHFKWYKIDASDSSVITGDTNETARVNPLTEGTHQFAFKVTDSDGAFDIDTVNMTVKYEPPPLVNKPPNAKAGTDQTITLPVDSINLSGTGTDPDSNGIKPKFLWKQLTGTAQANIKNHSAKNTKVNGLTKNGDYTFELMVTDAKGAFDKDTVLIIVLPPNITPNNPPTANAGIDITITLPENSVKLIGSGTDPDSNASITFHWKNLTESLHALIAAPGDSQTIAEKLDTGIYEFVLEVTDDQGATATDIVTITVNKQVILPPPPPDPLTIITIGGFGISAVLSGFYFFFWLRFTKKIIVFSMHADEEQLANSLMPDSTKTEGYRVGRCSREKINQMKKKGLAIHILNTTHLLINTPGNTQSFHYKFSKGKPTLKSTKNEAKPGVQIANLIPVKELKTAYDFPCFFIITLDTPLLPAFEQKIKGIGVQIIQHVPINSYILYVTEKAQVDKLHGEGFDFIRLVNHYSPRDTGLIVRTDHYKQAVDSDDQLILDLVLHREDDNAEVRRFLEQLKIFLIGFYRNRIRIRVPARTVLDYQLAANKFIQAIYEYIPPVLYNDMARQLVGIDTADPVKNVVAETGEGEIIGVADTGIDRDHPDLKSQILEATSWGRKETNDISDPHGHGTHVTGSIVGNGSASGGKIKGMAPGAKVFFQSLLDNTGSLANFDLQLHELFKQAYEKGARIHNNSWGADAEARYTIDSTVVDEFIYEHPEMLIIISAGNEGIENTKKASEKGFVGFESVGSPATTKNGLTVGASRNKRTTGGYASATYGKIWPDRFPDPPTSNELISGDWNSIAAFSSRGRCDDQRMKPDIVAPGTDILSVKSGLAPLNKFHGGYANYNDAYAFLSGTSMATPIVSGAAALVREYYKKKKGCATPSAALIKATLINGTRKLTGPSAIHGSDIIPNPNQGYGLLDLGFTIPNDQNKFQLEFRDSLQDPAVILNTTGQAYTLKLRTKQVTWIRACLSYTDFPVRSIQNDLDLLMDFEPTRQKWSGNLGINAQEPFANRDEDSTNNGEVIRIENAQSGLYTLKVIAHNLPKGKQGFALVVATGDMTATFE